MGIRWGAVKNYMPRNVANILTFNYLFDGERAMSVIYKLLCLRLILPNVASSAIGGYCCLLSLHRDDLLFWVSVELIFRCT